MSLVDVSSLDRRSGRLRCPSCGKYVESLAVLDSGGCLCRRCETEAGERAEAAPAARARRGDGRAR